jgi:hypothetical protein
MEDSYFETSKWLVLSNFLLPMKGLPSFFFTFLSWDRDWVFSI